jgi:ankyrin repeat protein
VARLLLDASPDPAKSCAVVDANGNTALHLACTADDVALVQILLEAGATLSAKNKEGKTPSDVAQSATFAKIKAYREQRVKRKQAENKRWVLVHHSTNFFAILFSADLPKSVHCP